jgi:hypothetical protein
VTRIRWDVQVKSPMQPNDILLIEKLLFLCILELQNICVLEIQTNCMLNIFVLVDLSSFNYV